MARVEWTQQALDDLDRVVRHLTQHNFNSAAARGFSIFKAVSILEQNPLLGHIARQGRRELVVGSRRQSYKVLYRYLHDLDIAFVVSVRSHKQA